MVFTKEDSYIIDEQAEAIYREYNIQYRLCVVSAIYIWSKIMDPCFAVHKLEKFLSNYGRVYFYGLVHFLKIH